MLISELWDFEGKYAKPQTYLFSMHLKRSEVEIFGCHQVTADEAKALGRMDEEKRKKKNKPLNG